MTDVNDVNLTSSVCNSERGQSIVDTINSDCYKTEGTRQQRRRGPWWTTLRAYKNSQVGIFRTSGDWYLLLNTKKNKNRCHQVQFMDPKCTQNAFAAGAPPRTPLGSSQRPQTPYLDFGPLQGTEGRRTGREGNGKERKGK